MTFIATVKFLQYCYQLYILERMSTLKNKTLAIVTGASKGIGRAIAIQLASDDYTIVCISKSDQEGLLNTVESIKGKGFNAYPILCDVSNYENVRNMYNEIKTLKLPVGVIINNAGISLVKLFQDTTPEEWHHVINTNLTSAYNMCHLGLNDMIHRKEGNIINISSIWGNEGASMEVAYSASKGGLNSFTKALAKELGPSNIKVNAIACGVINTEMNNFLSPEEKADLVNSISLGRYGTTSEVADLVTSMLTSTYLNGQIITLDGCMY